MYGWMDRLDRQYHSLYSLSTYLTTYLPHTSLPSLLKKKIFYQPTLPAIHERQHAIPASMRGKEKKKEEELSRGYIQLKMRTIHQSILPSYNPYRIDSFFVANRVNETP